MIILKLKEILQDKVHVFEDKYLRTSQIDLLTTIMKNLLFG